MKLSTLKRKTVVWKDLEYPPSELAAEWLPKLEKAFQKYQSTRDRLAVYPYLTAFYRFRTHFKSARDARAVGAEMIAQKGLSASRSDDPFNLIIRATATVDEKARWKWVRCLKFAFAEDIQPQGLQIFIMSYDGINKCAESFNPDS
jgi:hypothetical protein